jgi:5-methylcytosine-specific restriction endonuclease McrA
MPFNEETLRQIYDRTDGYCHICGKKLSFVNYARDGRRGAWEVEHSNPKVKGGSDYLRNLLPACIGCNRTKGTATTKTARLLHGRTSAPISKAKKQKNRNTTSGAVAGGIIGFALGGPLGALIGALGGGAIGNSVDPDRKKGN